MREFYTWASIAVIVIGSTAGDIFIAMAMQRVGDVSKLRRRAGVLGVVRAVVSTTQFWSGIFFMAIGYFSLLVALSWADVSLVVPASASLTFVTNAAVARVVLHENVDRRRWFSAVFVAAGVALLAQ
jgi:drug/metabolite transporter (DMT)-like permease